MNVATMHAVDVAVVVVVVAVVVEGDAGADEARRKRGIQVELRHFSRLIRAASTRFLRSLYKGKIKTNRSVNTVEMLNQRPGHGGFGKPVVGT